MGHREEEELMSWLLIDVRSVAHKDRQRRIGWGLLNNNWAGLRSTLGTEGNDGQGR